MLKLYADAGYQGPKFQQGLARVCRAVNVEIVWRCDCGKFVVLPKRWIVERTIAWLSTGFPALGVSAADAGMPLSKLSMILDRL